MKYINVVGAVLMRDGAILAARRGGSKALAGLWEFPGGKIESGESPIGALQREIIEELNCDIDVKGFLTTTEYEYSFGTVILSTYLAELRGEAPMLTEHTEIRWLRPEELFTVDWAPADIPAVEMLQRKFVKE